MLKDWITLLSAVLAVVISVYALYLSERAIKRVALADTIKTEYDLYNGMARTQIENPLQAHLFTIGRKAYRMMVQDIVAAVASADESERAKLQIEERGMAHYLLTAFEQIFFGWQVATRAGDQERALLLSEQLTYFNDAICNPRLHWYWDTKGGNLGVAFAETLNNHIRQGLRDCSTPFDPDGPFKRKTGAVCP